MEPLHTSQGCCRYRGLIGTGGIGTGVFFALNGNTTLGREESRSGRLLDRKDYCKLHIIAHYVQTLMGPDFATFAIGRVGNDDRGRRLLDEMVEAGLDTRYVRTVSGKPTLYCICFVYPDGTGGNLTVDDSACAEVDSAHVHEAEARIAALSRSGIVLAVPEVPLAARAELLELGTRHGCLRAASFTSAEIGSARHSGALTKVDLLAINIDEATVLTEATAEQPAASVAEAVVESLRQINPSMAVSITAGAHGSWVWDGEELTHAPSHEVVVANTAGAGDAHFAGILVGLASGLSLVEAQELGALIATLSVTSPHTINKDIDRKSLKTLADRLHLQMPAGVCRLLGQ